MGGGGVCRGVCIQGGLPGVGVCIQGGLPGVGVCIQGGSASRGGRPSQSDTMEYGQRAGGTHPTGMHSFFYIFSFPWKTEKMCTIQLLLIVTLMTLNKSLTIKCELQLLM